MEDWPFPVREVESAPEDPMSPPRQLHVVFVHGLFNGAQTWEQLLGLLRDDSGLAGFVVPRIFTYSSPRVRLRLDRRIADIDDIADQLGTYLRTELRDAPAIVPRHAQPGRDSGTALPGSDAGAG
jgi:hypothetical protein